jgi:hypothetical protein
MDEEGAKYQQVARLQYEEIERLRAAIREKDTELDVLIAWIAGDADALGALQSVYADPRSSPAIKTKAAIGAIAFERSKPASVSVVVDFKSRVHDARMTTVELRKQEWTRQPVLGSDHEGEALGPDSAA